MQLSPTSAARAGATPTMAAASPLVEEEVYPGDPDKWRFVVRPGHQIASTGKHLAPIRAASAGSAVELVRSTPHKYFGCVYPQEGHRFTPRLYLRSPDTRYISIAGVNKPEAYCAMTAEYVPLREGVQVDADEYTDGVLATYRGGSLSSRCPGRNQGVCDVPGCTLLSNPDPGDIRQGLLGDRWLLSAISSLAEFGGAIRRLFAKTRDLQRLPRDGFNRYTVELYDLRTWRPVEVVVDERLTWDEEWGCLLGCRPTRTGALWPCVLEKACAAHCGGWDKIDGGSCAHAFRLLTGCREVCQIFLESDGLYRCYGKYNSREGSWAQLGNSPHDGDQELYPAAWPGACGGGDVGEGVRAETLFAKMRAWREDGFPLCCGSRSKEVRSPSGVMDCRACSVLDVISRAGGSEFDLIKLRDQAGEASCGGLWAHGGPGWERHPEVYAACGSSGARDEGTCWVQKEDFFQSFQVFSLAAICMGHII